jgi:serine/threonine protein kinase
MEIASENFMHPEDSMSDLIFESYGATRAEAVFERKKQIVQARRNLKDHQLCWACGWTTVHQMRSSYNPRIKVVLTRENMGLWALGSKYLLKDFPNDGSSPGNDYVTHRFLQSQPNSSVPLLKEMQLLSKPTDKTYLLLMSRSESKSLESIWPEVTIKQRLDLRRQMLRILRELRKFTASGAHTVDGGKISDYILGGCSVTRPLCKTIGFNTEEWFANIEEELRVGLEKIHETKDPIIIEREYQKLKSNFPKSEPYILTHGDLTLGNILVDENIQITEIIDWEHAGYYPW